MEVKMKGLLLVVIIAFLNLAQPDTLKVEQKEIVTTKTDTVKAPDTKVDQPVKKMVTVKVEKDLKKDDSDDDDLEVLKHLGGNRNSDLEVLIPIFAIIMSLGIPIIAILSYAYSRKLKHQERMLAIEKGIDIPMEVEPVKKSDPKRALLKGFIALAVGIAFVITYFALPPQSDRSALVFFGSASSLIGLATIVWYSIVWKQGDKNDYQA
jgi:hypothetical protein